MSKHGLLELRAALREARLGETQEDEAEDRRRVLARFQPGIRAELIRRVPELLFQQMIGVVFFGWRDPAHELSPSVPVYPAVRYLGSPRSAPLS